MEIMYRSTRSEEEKVTASEAILKGLADDGGLFVPTGLPKLDVSLEALASMNYQEAAYEVMKLFLTDFTEEELKGCIAAAYDDKFDTAEIAPLKAVNGAYYLELFHGPTIAFKDMALSILPHLMITAARKNHEEKEKLAKAGYQFSSANSINIGRLVPQIAYYVWAYTRLGTTEAVNFVVPTGNFGNILAGYYAMQLGIPVQKLICASNSNKVLFDFFQTGEYDRNREFVLTTSPSMDILISSNLERLIFHIAGDDAAVNAAYMKDLAEKGSYHITEEMKERLAAFCSGWASEEETAAEIRRRYEEDRYVIDPHTAVASAVYGQYRKRTGDETKTVVVSTASPFKFETSVMSALGQPCNLPDLELADALSEISGVAVPEAVASLKNARIRHTTVCGRTVEEMTAEVERFLGL